MLCPKCGNIISDDCVFCEECGAKLDEVIRDCKSSDNLEQTEENTILEVENTISNNFSINENKNVEDKIITEKDAKNAKINKKIKLIVPIALLILVVVIVSSIYSKPRVNLNKYCSISVQGYNTVATAEIVFDREQFEKDYGNRKTKNKSELAELYSELTSSDSNASLYALEECFKGGFNKSSSIENGDEIVYTWACDNETALKLGYKIKCSSIRYKVSGLEEVDTFNPFDDINVVVDGISPNGRARIEYINDNRYDYGFTFDKSSELKDGDVITVTVKMNGSFEDFAKEYGAIPSPLEQKYDVVMQKYIKSIDDLSEEDLKGYKEFAEKYYKEIDFDDSEKLEKIEFVGDYILYTNDENSWFGYENKLILVYKVSVNNNSSSYSEINEFYWFMGFNDVVNINNDIENLNDRYRPSGTVNFDSGTRSWEYKGYKTLDDLKAEEFTDDSYDILEEKFN